MIRLIKLEFLKWLRSNKLWIVIFIFLFSGFCSPISTYYAKDIMNILNNNMDAKLIFDSPTWQSLLQSYFKNSSQIIVFVMAYISATMCLLGDEVSLQIFYKTRIKNKIYLYFPKYIACVFILILGLVLGSLSIIYIILSFFNGFNWQEVLFSLLVQMYGFIIFITLAIALSIWMRSSFFSALLIEILIFLSSIFHTTVLFKEWFITILLNPSEILTKGTYWSYLQKPVLIGAVIFVISLVFIIYGSLQKVPIRAFNTVEKKYGCKN